jgi:hypothetical protein
MQHNPRHHKSPGIFLSESWRRYLLPLLVGVGSVSAGILLDLALGIESRPILYSDMFTGSVAAVLAFFVARYYERLRRSDSERLRVAADVNHHVRNALTTVLYSVHLRRDTELIRVTQAAVDRIDWTLREILWESDQQPSAAKLPDGS